MGRQTIQRRQVGMKKSVLLFIAAAVLAFAAVDSSAQRAAVSGAEVTGTFSTGGEADNKVKIAALGGGQLRVEFSLVWMWRNSAGEWMANTGEPSGIASIEADEAVLDLSQEGRECKIRIKFVKPGTIEVSEGDDCGGIVGGMNVTSVGTYKKISKTRPKFSDPE